MIWSASYGSELILSAVLGPHECWHVPVATALELIEFPGKLGASGKRPRFRFTTRQRRITSYLSEIDAALAAAGEGSGVALFQASRYPILPPDPD